jgi:hypothetical protein
MTMTHITNSNAAPHELSIEELDSVAGGGVTVKGLVDAILVGAVAGTIAGAAVTTPVLGAGAPAGCAVGAVGGGVTYLVAKFLE